MVLPREPQMAGMMAPGSAVPCFAGNPQVTGPKAVAQQSVLPWYIEAAIPKPSYNRLPLTSDRFNHGPVLKKNITQLRIK